MAGEVLTVEQVLEAGLLVEGVGVVVVMSVLKILLLVATVLMESPAWVYPGLSLPPLLPPPKPQATVMTYCLDYTVMYWLVTQAPSSPVFVPHPSDRLPPRSLLQTQWSKRHWWLVPAPLLL
jgi:hypothetical protein